MHSAMDVAKWFLCHNEVETSCGADYISNMKLQKLLYYAQGAFLAVTGEPLFADNIEAWEHGPVVPAVYHAYKDNGRAGIPAPTDFDSQSFTDDEMELLTEVYNEFGQYSAWKLREMTHNETPWKSTKRNCVISTESIRDYFRKYYVA